MTHTLQEWVQQLLPIVQAAKLLGMHRNTLRTILEK